MSDNATQAQAWVALALLGLTATQLARLLRAFGSAQAVLDAPKAQLAALVPEAKSRYLLKDPDPALLEKAACWLEEDGHTLITWADPDYPQALLSLDNAPPILFFVGNRALLNAPALAIVGSRNATPQGLEHARAFAETLAHAGVTIVSGMALGIDAAAHEGGLLGCGGTLAVIGTGPDRIYPAQHRDLAHRIAEQGGMISEFLPGTPPLRENFPRRNRIISGLAQGVLVVEATLSSGSLITARLAADQGREVFAVPGSIHSPFSKGCHKLIREGAKLVETAQDILDELPSLCSQTQITLALAQARPQKPLAKKTTKKTSPDAPPVLPSTNEHPILAALGYEPVDFDVLMTRSSLTAESLSATLTELELSGAVVALPGGRWQRHIKNIVY